MNSIIFRSFNDQNVSEDFTECAIDKVPTHNLGYVSVKGLQYKVILEALNGHDVFAVLLMGFGKSLTQEYHIYLKLETKSLQNPVFCSSAHTYNNLINIPAERLLSQCHQTHYSRCL